MLAGVIWREFRIGVCREVDLPHGGAVQDMVRCPRNGGAVRGQRELERRLLQLFEVMRKSRV